MAAFNLKQSRMKSFSYGICIFYSTTILSTGTQYIWDNTFETTPSGFDYSFIVQNTKVLKEHKCQCSVWSKPCIVWSKPFPQT